MEERDRESVNITNARFGRSVDLRHRQVRYLVSMGIRTACFIAAVATSGPLRWVLVVAALFLPYIAVVLANNGSHRDPDEAESVTSEPIGEITERKSDE
ncbi:MAG: DUF3099 domain-containing protein [Streptosporangiaceae bacterium]